MRTKLATRHYSQYVPYSSLAPDFETGDRLRGYEGGSRTTNVKIETAGWAGGSQTEGAACVSCPSA